MIGDPLLRARIDADQAEAHSRGLASISYVDARLADAFGQEPGFAVLLANEFVLEPETLLPDMIVHVRYLRVRLRTFERALRRMS